MKLYRLAIHNGYESRPFGPMMTLADATFYQGQMTQAGKPVLVVNTAAI